MVGIKYPSNILLTLHTAMPMLITVQFLMISGEKSREHLKKSITPFTPITWLVNERILAQNTVVAYYKTLGIVVCTVYMCYPTSISKRYFCPGGMAQLESMRSVRAVGDTPLADSSAPGRNITCRVAYRPLVAVSLFLLTKLVSYFKWPLWRCGQLWQMSEWVHWVCASIGIAMQWVTLRQSNFIFLLPARRMKSLLS